MKHLALFLLSFCLGCANYMAHTDATRPARPYEGTKTIGEVLVIACSPDQQDYWDRFWQTISRITFPLILGDFALELVADTITLPYDLIKKD